ncbi:MAG: DUF6550 family protein [Mobilitalea sp.]
MKNMNDKTKKRLIVAGGMVMSVALIVMIGVRLTKAPTDEVVIPAQSAEISDVVVDNQNDEETSEKEEAVTVAPIEVTKEPQKDSGAVDAGTDQKIQGDVPEKPTYTEEQLTDPTQKPNGEKVESPTVEDDTTPTATPKPEKTETTTEQNTSGGLPGFDSVPDGGSNQVVEADDMYENGNKIGNMD